MKICQFEIPSTRIYQYLRRINLSGNCSFGILSEEFLRRVRIALDHFFFYMRITVAQAFLKYFQVKTDAFAQLLLSFLFS